MRLVRVNPAYDGGDVPGQSELVVLADELAAVRRTGVLDCRCATPIGELDLATAYEVQDLLVAELVAAGEVVVGRKVGCTSRAVQEQFGLTQPVTARLLAPHVHDSGARLRAADFVQCAVEAELVLTIGASPDPAELSDEALASCVASVSAGIEVHHYVFAHGAPTSQELIASNALHGAVVLDGGRPPTGVDLPMDGVGLWVNGALRASALQAEILGRGPWESLRWLVRHLDAVGRRLEPGELVLPGSAVPLVPVAAGDVVQARFTSFGSCEVTFT
jgi:2-keto-4-pentenoate hydratase